MLYMCFHIGEVSYVIQARSIESVTPCVNLQPCAEPDSQQSGNLLYKQKLIPVYDLCQLLLQRPAESALSTRILLLSNDADPGTLCGIIVEQATGTIRLDELPNSLQPGSAASTLTETVLTESGGTLQLIKLDQLIKMLLNTSMHPGSEQHGANNGFQTGPTR